MNCPRQSVARFADSSCVNASSRARSRPLGLSFVFAPLRRVLVSQLTAERRAVASANFTARGGRQAGALREPLVDLVTQPGKFVIRQSVFTLRFAYHFVVEPFKIQVD